MGELRISLPDDLHKQLRIMAISDGTCLKDMVTSILKEYAGRESGTHKAPNPVEEENA